MRKFLLCSTLIALFGDVSATDNNGLLPEVANENSDLMANFPTDVPTLQAGTLKYDSHLYDLICTGNCNLVKKDGMPPDVLHMDKVPSFVEVCKEGANVGQIVFTEPKPMGTVSLPAGHDAYVTISLQKVRSAFEQTNAGKAAVKYVALGVRVQGEDQYAEVLRVPLEADDANAAAKNVPSVCFHMGTGNVVELVPLLSATDMSGDDGYTAVEPGAVANQWAFLSGTNPTAFNFDSVLRAEVECANEEPEKESTWKKQNWEGEHGDTIFYANGVFFSYNGDNKYLYYLDNSNWIKTQGTFPRCVHGIFYYDQSGEYLALTEFADVYVSKNKDSWSPCSDIVKSGNIATVTSAVELENKIITVGSGCEVSVLDYGDKTLTFKTSVPIQYSDSNQVGGVCYGDGALIVVSNYGERAISSNDGDTWPVVENGCLFNWSRMCGLAFGKEGFLALSVLGDLKISINKGGSWQNFGNISSEWKDISNSYYLHNLISDGDAFYAIDGSGNVYSQAKPIDLTK